MDAVERLMNAAGAHVVLSDDRVTSASDGKLRPSGQEGTEELADRSVGAVVPLNLDASGVPLGTSRCVRVGMNRQQTRKD